MITALRLFAAVACLAAYTGSGCAAPLAPAVGDLAEFKAAMGAGSRSRRDHAGSDGYVHDNWRSDKKCTKDGKCPKCMKYKEKFCNRAFMQQSCCTTCGCNKKERRRERRTVDIERQRSTRSTEDMWSDDATAYGSSPSTGWSGETRTGSVDVCKKTPLRVQGRLCRVHSIMGDLLLLHIRGT